MAKIIASPSDLIKIARQDKKGVFILLPHAYEAARSLRRLGIESYMVASAPSIAGKIGLLSVGGATAYDEDVDTFSMLSPVCGMKDGRIVNTTGHVLPFDDAEEDREEPETPISEDVDDYILQRAGNEWYYYEYAAGETQSAFFRYVHLLATINAEFGVRQ